MSLILFYKLLVLISTPALTFNVAAVVISEWLYSLFLVSCILGDTVSLVFDKLWIILAIC